MPNYSSKKKKSIEFIFHKIDFNVLIYFLGKKQTLMFKALSWRLNIFS